jgi:hypothetical protein
MYADVWKRQSSVFEAALSLFPLKDDWYIFISVMVVWQIQFSRDVQGSKSTTHVSLVILVSGPWDFAEEFMRRIILALSIRTTIHCRVWHLSTFQTEVFILSLTRSWIFFLFWVVASYFICWSYSSTIDLIFPFAFSVFSVLNCKKFHMPKCGLFSLFAEVFW